MIQNNYQGALQHPLGSRFNAASSAADVIKGIDLTGKIAIVTGGNSGIGLETTKTLAAAGATVIVAVRNSQQAKNSLAEFPNVEVEEMDLLYPDSVDAFSQQFLKSGRALHILINNAGIMWVPLRRDNRGYESQLAINYLGHFQLTAGLWPALKAAKGARIVNLSSHGHHSSAFNFEDPNFLNHEYQTLLGYGQSKTATNLFSLELDARAKEHKVRVFSVHPGSVGDTGLGREASLETFQQMGFLDAHGNLLPEIAASLKTVPQGAATSVWCAVSPLLNNIGGVYCEDADIAVLANGETNANGVKQYSLDESNAKRLWLLTEDMLGLKFNL